MDDIRQFGSLRDTIAALRDGSLAAFDVLYYKYVGKVHNFLLKVSSDSALSEDLTQEVFIKLWRLREELDPERNIESWLFVCARNLFLNELRHRRQGEAFAAETRKTARPEADSTLDQVHYRQAERTLAALIREMPPQRRRVFVLSRLYGLPAAEIARQMDISERTVENQLYQARKQIASRVKENS